MVEIALAESDDEVDRALAIAGQVWGQPPVSQPIARAMTFAGWYVSIASDHDGPVGMCAGFVGLHGADLHLHSHLAAVLPHAQGQGIGRALKAHQRSWCLDHGIEEATWTFDPLVRENARFNLHHLGALGERYLVDLYGSLDDDINHGQPTDRLLVRWDLTGDEATAALGAPLPPAAAGVYRSAGAVDAIRLERGSPVAEPADADLRLVATPESIVDLRRTDPATALAWRLAVRAAMTAAFDDGLVPAAMADDGSYVMVRRA